MLGILIIIFLMMTDNTIYRMLIVNLEILVIDFSIHSGVCVNDRVGCLLLYFV